MALTIRADQDFENKLNELKVRLGIKTGTGVIKHLVTTYGRMADELADTRRELAMVKYQLDNMVAGKDTIKKELVDFLEKLEILDNSFWS